MTAVVLSVSLSAAVIFSMASFWWVWGDQRLKAGFLSDSQAWIRLKSSSVREWNCAALKAAIGCCK
jgi:hypothetical protein